MPEQAEEKLEELAEQLRGRQYREDVIAAGIERAKAVTREEALERRVKVGERKPPHLICTYDRRTSPALAPILRSHYEGMIRRDRRLKEVFPDSPRPVFKRGPNIKDLLTRAKVPPSRNATCHTSTEQWDGVTRCSKDNDWSGCVLCPFIMWHHNEVVREVKIKSSKDTVAVKGRFTCKYNKGGGTYW